MGEAEIDEVRAHREIHAALLSYTRGIDRLDADAIAAAFHPGATLDFGSGIHSIEEFAPYAVRSLRDSYDATQHRISNTAIELHGDAARVETYVLAFHIELGPDGRILHTFNGRYVDTFERRDGAWKIARRILRRDWTSREPLTAEMTGQFVSSARDRSDPLYDEIT